MNKYWAAALLGAFLGLCGCQWQTREKQTAYYPIEGITAYKGQTASSLFANNGMPNQIQNLSDGGVIWIYYNNYQPLGVGELVTYNTADNQNANTANCRVQVLLRHETVQEVASNCQ